MMVAHNSSRFIDFICPNMPGFGALVVWQL